VIFENTKIAALKGHLKNTCFWRVVNFEIAYTPKNERLEAEKEPFGNRKNHL